MIQLSDYRSGGYFLTRQAKRSDWMAEFLPDNILSISSDICDFVPDVWTLEWTSSNLNTKQKKALEFGLNAGAHQELMGWVTKEFNKKEIGFCKVIFRLEMARYIREHFLRHLPDMVLFGIGLHSSLCDDFLDKTKPAPTVPGFAPNGETGAHAAISLNLPLAPNGIPLGFEPVVHGIAGLECSWLCNSLEVDAREKFKISINERGFIDNFDDALKLTNLINKGVISAEPGLWLPWLLVDYTQT